MDIKLNLNEEQQVYLKRVLTEGLKNIEKAWEDNLIFHECDQIEANETEEMIKSILEQL